MLLSTESGKLASASKAGLAKVGTLGVGSGLAAGVLQLKKRCSSAEAEKLESSSVSTQSPGRIQQVDVP